jgi:hypothetical protein
MVVTVRSTGRESLPYSGFVMDAGADRSKPRIDVASLQVGAQYRVDWRHEQLRRTFRFKGTLLAIEEMATTDETDETAEPQTSLTFEVKPRFGAATVQRVELATVRTIEPA